MIQYIGRLRGVSYWECTQCRAKYTMAEPITCIHCQNAWWLPGNLLAVVFGWFGLKATSRCGCAQRKAALNGLGQKWYYYCARFVRSSVLLCRNLFGCVGGKCHLRDTDAAGVDELQNVCHVDSKERI